MLTRRFVLSLALAGISTLALAGCDDKPAAAGGEAKGATKITLAVIPKGQTHPFWQAVKKGVDKAATDLNVKIVWIAAQDESNYSEQIGLVSTTASNPLIKGVALAPLSADSLLQPVKDLRAKGLPVVIFDSGLNGKVGEDFASFVGTDNTVAGHAGGVALAKVMGENKKAVLLRYQQGSASTEQREDGFLAAAKESGLTMVSDNQFAGTTVASAKDKATAMMDAVIQSGGVFASNQSASLGMYDALLDAKKSGKIQAGQIKMVAFDAHPALVQGLLDGDITAIVVQNPEVMGYKTVQTLLAAIKGEKVAELVDSGYEVVTKENLNDPKIRAILLAYDSEIARLLPGAPAVR